MSTPNTDRAPSRYVDLLELRREAIDAQLEAHRDGDRPMAKAFAERVREIDGDLLAAGLQIPN